LGAHLLINEGSFAAAKLMGLFDGGVQEKVKICGIHITVQETHIL
jgi:hypothetical protein